MVTQPPSWLYLLCLRHNCKILDTTPIPSPPQDTQRNLNNQRHISTISTDIRNHVNQDNQSQSHNLPNILVQNETHIGSSSKRTRSGVPIRDNFTNLKNDSQKTSFHGIRNIGNSCYLAATLHLIFGCNQWVAAINRVYNRFSLSSGVGPRTTPIMYSLLEIAHYLGVLKIHDARNNMSSDTDICSTGADPKKFKNSCRLKFHG